MAPPGAKTQGRTTACVMQGTAACSSPANEQCDGTSPMGGGVTGRRVTNGWYEDRGEEGQRALCARANACPCSEAQVRRAEDSDAAVAPVAPTHAVRSVGGGVARRAGGSGRLLGKKSRARLTLQAEMGGAG